MLKNKCIAVSPIVLQKEDRDNTTIPTLKSILLRYKIFKKYANEGMVQCSIIAGYRDFRSVKWTAVTRIRKYFEQLFIPIEAMQKIRVYRCYRPQNIKISL